MTLETITLNAGSGGSAVAVDTVTARSYQLIKMMAGYANEVQFGATPYYYRAAAAANQDATAPKSSAGIVYSLVLTNTNTSTRYFKLYNTATPTSASTPVQSYAIPGSGGIALSFPHGLLFLTAIGFRLTTGSADNDANAVSAGEVLVNLGYV